MKDLSIACTSDDTDAQEHKLTPSKAPLIAGEGNTTSHSTSTNETHGDNRRLMKNNLKQGLQLLEQYNVLGASPGLWTNDVLH